MSDAKKIIIADDEVFILRLLELTLKKGGYEVVSCRDGKEALATKHALFFRSIFRAVLASSLESVRSGDVEALCLFGDRLEAALKRRLASQPAPMYSFVQSIVLARQA